MDKVEIRKIGPYYVIVVSANGMPIPGGQYDNLPSARVALARYRRDAAFC